MACRSTCWRMLLAARERAIARARPRVSCNRTSRVNAATATARARLTRAESRGARPLSFWHPACNEPGTMLVISRRKGQRVSIGEEIGLVVTEVHRSSVKLGIRAPRGLTVLRGEIRDSIEEANRLAAASSVEDAGALSPVAPAKGAEISAIPVTVLRRPAARP